jgi:phosphatidylglycerol:prolipoprotein diacylglycerol transferase
MVFPAAGSEPRHPSQLYELGLEGIALFLLLWLTRRYDWSVGARLGLFLVGYAVARIFCEQFRQPDAQLGFLFAGVTMGMLLSTVMLLAGTVLLWYVFTGAEQQEHGDG